MTSYKVRIGNNGAPTLRGKHGKLIGSGISRKVYRVGRYVVKVERKECHTYFASQNKSEHAFFNGLSRKMRRNFATVLRYGECGDYSYVVQTYIKGQRKTERGYHKIDHIECETGIVDVHGHNWRQIKNGNVKIIDMGMSC